MRYIQTDFNLSTWLMSVAIIIICRPAIFLHHLIVKLIDNCVQSVLSLFIFERFWACKADWHAPMYLSHLRPICMVLNGNFEVLIAHADKERKWEWQGCPFCFVLVPDFLFCQRLANLFVIRIHSPKFVDFWKHYLITINISR